MNVKYKLGGGIGEVEGGGKRPANYSIENHSVWSEQCNFEENNTQRHLSLAVDLCFTALFVMEMKNRNEKTARTNSWVNGDEERGLKDPEGEGEVSGHDSHSRGETRIKSMATYYSVTFKSRINF